MVTQITWGSATRYTSSLTSGMKEALCKACHISHAHLLSYEKMEKVSNRLFALTKKREDGSLSAFVVKEQQLICILMLDECADLRHMVEVCRQLQLTSLKLWAKGFTCFLDLSWCGVVVPPSFPVLLDRLFFGISCVEWDDGVFVRGEQ